MALLRLAAPRDGRPLLAAEPCGRLIAVSSCGLVVHALRGTERVASWRLPSRALRLLWCDSAASNPEGTAALAAVAEDGRCWWLELPTAAAASSGTVKRMRAGGRSAAVVTHPRNPQRLIHTRVGLEPLLFLLHGQRVGVRTDTGQHQGQQLSATIVLCEEV